MKICLPHWEKLRKAIADRGLDHLGAKSGEEAITSIKEELSGGEPPFDPLMACNNMIWSRGLEIGGLYLMSAKEDGEEYCPICEAIAHKPADADVQWIEDYWILGPADAALSRCRDLGLVAREQ